MSASEPRNIIALFTQGWRHGLEERTFCPSVFSRQREKWNVTPIIWAVDSVRKTGCGSVKLQPEPQLLNEAEEVFYAVGPVLSCHTAHNRPQHTQGHQVWLQHDGALSLQQGRTEAFGPKSAFAFKTQSHFGGIQEQSPEGGEIAWLQLISEQWWNLEWCLGAQKAALSSVLFWWWEKKTNSAHQECLNKKRILTNYFSAKLGLAKSTTECEI